MWIAFVAHQMHRVPLSPCLSDLARPCGIASTASVCMGDWDCNNLIWPRMFLSTLHELLVMLWGTSRRLLGCCPASLISSVRTGTNQPAAFCPVSVKVVMLYSLHKGLSECTMEGHTSTLNVAWCIQTGIGKYNEPGACYTEWA